MTRRGLVLDIETALDREAVARAGRSGPGAFPRPWLHRVVAASMLTFAGDPSGTQFTEFALDTQLAVDPGDEAILLESIAQHLAMLGEDDVLITFNGRSHDLPILAHRRLRHCLLTRLPRPTHHDLMRMLSAGDAQRWPTLRDVCAALEIPCDCRGRSCRAAALNPLVVKCETDVAASFLVHCLLTAERQQSPAPLFNGWTGLADYLLQRSPTQQHLTQFATSPRALAARQQAFVVSP